MINAMAWPRLARMLEDSQSVAVLSIQHTGTWFAIDFLRSHPMAGPFHELVEVIHAGGLVTRSVIHAHLIKDVHPADAHKHMGFEGLAILAATGRVIVPIRDPMLSLITRHARHPMMDHRYIVQAYQALARLRPPVTYLPVDQTPLGRENRLRAVLGAAGLPALTGHVEAWAHHWPAKNPTHLSAEKQAYHNGDWGHLRKAMGAEIAALLSAKSDLVPFLSELRYHALPWWSL